MPRVRFEKKDPAAAVEFDVGFGSNLYRAALVQPVSLFNGPMKILHCWGKGLCGACFVEVLRGAEILPEPTAAERKKLKGALPGIRLACQIPVKGDLVIRKPPGILRPRPERSRPVSRETAAAGSPVSPAVAGPSPAAAGSGVTSAHA